MLTRKELQEKGLFKQTHKVLLPAGVVTAGAFTITAQRGNVQAVGMLVAGGTDVQYSECGATLKNNGLDFIETDTLLAYSPTYRFKERSLTPIVLVQNGTVNYNYDNASAVPLVAIIELYFYNPFDMDLRNENTF